MRSSGVPQPGRTPRSLSPRPNLGKPSKLGPRSALQSPAAQTPSSSQECPGCRVGCGADGLAQVTWKRPLQQAAEPPPRPGGVGWGQQWGPGESPCPTLASACHSEAQSPASQLPLVRCHIVSERPGRGQVRGGDVRPVLSHRPHLCCFPVVHQALEPSLGPWGPKVWTTNPLQQDTAEALPPQHSCRLGLAPHPSHVASRGAMGTWAGI